MIRRVLTEGKIRNGMKQNVLTEGKMLHGRKILSNKRPIAPPPKPAAIT